MAGVTLGIYLKLGGNGRQRYKWLRHVDCVMIKTDHLNKIKI